MKRETEIHQLIQAVVAGETKSAVELSERLLNSGFPVEGLIHEGLTAALCSLDAKCTNEEFNLLEIMLAGRSMMAVMDKVVPKVSAPVFPDRTCTRKNHCFRRYKR